MNASHKIPKPQHLVMNRTCLLGPLTCFPSNLSLGNRPLGNRLCFPLPSSSLYRRGVAVALMLLWFVLSPATSHAQTDSSLVLNSGTTVRGNIISASPESITLATNRGEREIGVGEIRQIRLANEPNWLNGAKTRYRENRYDVCYEQIVSEKLESDDPLVIQEVKYYLAMSAAQLAASGADVTTQQAGNLLLEFINNHPDSFNLFPAIETFADLALESGAFAKSVEFYSKLQGVQSPEFKQRAQLKLGKAKLYDSDYAGAKEALLSAETLETSDRTAQLIARCLYAQAISHTGETEKAITILHELIKNENSSQTELFAQAYNALGVCHLNNQDLKAARTAFMHTQLLFFTDRQSHAEALYHLHQISNMLQDSERSAQTRQTLKSRYRNTHWANKL